MEALHTFLLLILILSSIFIFISKNPVHSVLFLIFIVCNTALILFLFNADFLGIIFIIIYVGAVAVLFLFIVMMLNIKISYSDYFYFYPIIFIGITVFCLKIESIVSSSFSNFNYFKINFNLFNNLLDDFSNISIIGQGLFNYYGLVFLIAGLILLIAMIGAICLTLKFSSSRENEFIAKQLIRSEHFLSFFK